MVKITLDCLKGRQTNCNIPLSAAFLNTDITDSDYIKRLIHKGASYLVIPAPRNPILFDPETILISVLTNNSEKLQNMLLDLTLPFIYNGDKAPPGMYFGRYLIFDRKLIGIRLNCFSHVASAKEDENYKKW